ncbi:MAG: oxidoreductase [Planctomycetes bacterium B3_Pla]|nr:MAG: oxidoreductase [Planctomycetes bacterium B3_Pla]
MRLLAISDTYIPADFMRDGLSELKEIGVDVEVRHWGHDSLIDLQQDNLAIESGGPEAVELPKSITQNLQSFDIVVVQFVPISRPFIEKAENLKLIGVLRGGAENIDVEFATQRNISVMNTPGRNARAVAECTIGMILAEIRNIARSHASLKSNNWQRSFPNSDAIPELCGKTVGLVGYGAVGRLVAGYLNAFESKIIAFDPYCTGNPAPAELVDLEFLMKNSDIVSMHARLTKESFHLIGEKELAMMKPTAVLVNTARSGLVDERALIKALEEKRIAGAALDVFDEEPLPTDHPFIRLQNATITAHLAGSTIDSFRNSPKLMAGHLRNCLCGREDIPVINGIKPSLKNTPERR